MATTNPPLPDGTLTAAVLVLLYSFFSLGLTVVLFIMLQRHGERWSYISLISFSVSGSSAASIVQQIYFVVNWHSIKTTEFHQAKLSQEYPSIALGPLSTGFNLALYWIQMYLYNVTSFLILWWAFALVKGVYNFRLRSMALWQSKLVLTSKLVAFLLPGVFIGVPFADALQKQPVASLVITCAPMMFCFVVGSICVVFILFKYVNSRALFASIQGSQSNPMSSGTVQTASSPATTRKIPQSAKIRIDKWLLFRFMICFLILSAFEVAVIIFEWTRYTGSKQLAAQTEPSYSASTVTSSITQFLPGVTCGLLAFLIFGTTGPFRKIYLENMRTCLQRRRKRPSFDNTERRRATPSVEHGWRNLDRGAPGAVLQGPTPGYSCTVRGGGDTDSIELTKPCREEGRGKGIMVVHEQEQDLEEGRWNDDDIALGRWEKRLGGPLDRERR